MQSKLHKGTPNSRELNFVEIVSLCFRISKLISHYWNFSWIPVLHWSKACKPGSISMLIAKLRLPYASRLLPFSFWSLFFQLLNCSSPEMMARTAEAPVCHNHQQPCKDTKCLLLNRQTALDPENRFYKFNIQRGDYCLKKQSGFPWSSLLQISSLISHTLLYINKIILLWYIFTSPKWVQSRFSFLTRVCVCILKKNCLGLPQCRIIFLYESWVSGVRLHTTESVFKVNHGGCCQLRRLCGRTPVDERLRHSPTSAPICVSFTGQQLYGAQKVPLKK